MSFKIRAWSVDQISVSIYFHIFRERIYLSSSLSDDIENLFKSFHGAIMVHIKKVYIALMGYIIYA